MQETAMPQATIALRRFGVHLHSWIEPQMRRTNPLDEGIDRYVCTRCTHEHDFFCDFPLDQHVRLIDSARHFCLNRSCGEVSIDRSWLIVEDLIFVAAPRRLLGASCGAMRRKGVFSGGGRRLRGSRNFS